MDERDYIALNKDLNKMKLTLIDTFQFSEWIGLNYIRLNNCWVHRFESQLNSENFKDTGELWKWWFENVRDN